MKFLVAVDGSDPSARALDHAVEVAEAAGASVAVVHAVAPEVHAEQVEGPVTDRSTVEGAFVAEALADAEERGERVLARMAGRADGATVEVTTELLYGDPVVAVADHAEEAGFDGVFVGHRGVGERYEALLGSVAKGLVGRSSVPVTVVH